MLIQTALCTPGIILDHTENITSHLVLKSSVKGRLLASNLK